MHRDAGVDQELRTSHGPIQVTDNVNPKKSYIYVTDDNTQTPQNLYKNDVNDISNGFGVIKMGSITDNLDFGITGGNQNGKLIISANRNKQPGTLELGYDEGKGVGSNKVIIGIGKYLGINVKKGAIYFYGLDSQGNNPQIASVAYYPKQESPDIAWGSYSALELKNPYSKSSVSLAAFKNKAISSIIMGTDGYRRTMMTFDAKGDKPISFIGSIGGVFENVSQNEYNNLTKLDGEQCAGGKGVWKLVATGVTSEKLKSQNPGSYDYDLETQGSITGTPAGSPSNNGINIRNIRINFKNISSSTSFSAIAFNMAGSKGAGVSVENAKNTPITVTGSTTGTYFLICVPQANSNYNKAVNGFYIKKHQLDTNIQY